MLFVLFSVFAVVASEPCDDLDVSLCTLIMNREPGICSDSCLAKLCPRSCGTCALKCYGCSVTTDASNCTNVVTCSDPTDYCFTAQTFSSHFTEVYKLGCGSRQTCIQYSHGKRGSAEAACCNQNLCNNKPPPLLKIIQPHNFTEINSTLCVNKDDDICHGIRNHLDNPCDQDCIATKLCPKMCGQCFNCLNCLEASHPNNCTELIGCGNGKFCYGMEKLRPDFSTAVQLGCIDQTLCNKLQSPAIHIFGRRSFSLNGNCCQGEKCNLHPMVGHIPLSEVHTTYTTSQLDTSTKPSTNPTTDTTEPNLPHSTDQTTTQLSITRPYPTVPSHCQVMDRECPAKYYRVYGECYLYGIKENKTMAEKLCKDHCGELAYFRERKDVDDVDVYIRFTRVQVTEFLTDMERDANNKWFWRHNLSPVAQELLGHEMNAYPSLKCAVLDIQYDYFNGVSYRFRPVSCEDQYHPLCIYRLY